MRIIFPILLGSNLLIAFAAHGQKTGDRVATSNSRTHSTRSQPATQPTDKPPFHHPLLTTEALAIAVAEPILFSIFGRENIIQQRPYSVRLRKGCWHLSGTLPGLATTVGGTFYLVIEASNCRVQTIFHTK